MFVCCECCVLSGRGLCDELITRPEESYQLWCVVVCGLGTSRMRRPCPALGRSATAKKKCLQRLPYIQRFIWSKLSNFTLFFPYTVTFCVATKTVCESIRKRECGCKNPPTRSGWLEAGQ